MGGRYAAMAMAIGGALLLLVGVWTNSWWTGNGLLPVEMGLREICAMGRCESLSEIPGHEGFKLFASATFFLGIATAVGLLAGVGLRYVQDDDSLPNMLARWSASACGLVILFGLLTVFTLPGAADAAVSWGLWVTLIGCMTGALGGFAHSHSAFGWEGGGTYVPVKPASSTAPRVAASEPVVPIAPAPAAAGGAASARQQSYDLEQQVRSATAPAKVLDPVRTRHRPVGGGASTVANAAADASRAALRFVARSVELSGAGLSVILDRGGQIDIAWSDIDRIVARRMPPDPPFEKTIIVDISHRGASTPVRLLPSTRVNYDFLPNAGVSSRDNLRRLGAYANLEKPGIIEEHSRGFFTEGKVPPHFMAMKQFAAYDSQYG